MHVGVHLPAPEALTSSLHTVSHTPCPLPPWQARTHGVRTCTFSATTIRSAPPHYLSFQCLSRTAAYSSPPIRHTATHLNPHTPALKIDTRRTRTHVLPYVRTRTHGKVAVDTLDSIKAQLLALDCYIRVRQVRYSTRPFTMLPALQQRLACLPSVAKPLRPAPKCESRIRTVAPFCARDANATCQSLMHQGQQQGTAHAAGDQHAPRLPCPNSRTYRHSHTVFVPRYSSRRPKKQALPFLPRAGPMHDARLRTRRATQRRK